VGWAVTFWWRILRGSHLYDDEDIEGAEGGRDHHEEVAGYYDFAVITDEGQPTLFRVECVDRAVSAEVLSDGARGDLNAQLELSLAMRSSPPSRGERHER
jgi:hypothetical protein